jgi:hypothetical protein
MARHDYTSHLVPGPNASVGDVVFISAGTAAAPILLLGRVLFKNLKRLCQIKFPPITDFFK